MRICDLIDGGVVTAASIKGSEVTFDLRPKQQLLSVLLRDVPASVTLHFLLDEKGAGFLVRQGIVLSVDGRAWRAHALESTGEQRWSVTVRGGGDLRIANRQPYGRDGLDRLLCDLHGHTEIRPRFLQRDHRSLVVFECGHDDGRKPIHYVIGGEDVGETSGSIVVDGMLRELAAAGDAAQTLLANTVMRIVPVVSLFCAARPRGPSYDTLDGRDIYGAATWGDEDPPPEYRLLRDLVEESIEQRRLNLMLCVHSWQAEQIDTGMEFIRSSGDHTLSAPREAAAAVALEQLMRSVPRGRTRVADRIWYPGLARDYLMRQHNVVSFRVEITTAENPTCDFIQTARCFVENVAAVHDWSFVLP